MKLHVMSDLHLEFAPMDLPGGDVLLLAGDICVAAHLEKHRTDDRARSHKKVCKKFFFEECSKYNSVYYIAGNHEHYSGVFDHTVETLKEFLLDSNVKVLDKEVVNLDGWNLYAATMWTDYNRNDIWAKMAAQQGLNDHYLIKKLKGNALGKFSADDALEEHNLALKKLDEMLYEWQVIDKLTIVMTHHAPTYKSIHEKYQGDALNYAYVSDLSETILRHKNIKYWIHGHTHTAFDYMVDECRVIANPRGYARHGSKNSENEEFNVNFGLEI
jgi:predicted phosphodiesterase